MTSSEIQDETNVAPLKVAADYRCIRAGYGYYTIEVDSYSAFIHQIAPLFVSTGVNGDSDDAIEPQTFVWRGMRHPSWTLQSTLSRRASEMVRIRGERWQQTVSQLTTEHLVEFLLRLRGLNLVNREHDDLHRFLSEHRGKKYNSFLTVLQKMSAAQLNLTRELFALGQHHDLFTPFLDWTSVPLIALYFAFSAHDERHDGVGDRVVFALNKTAVENFCPPQQAQGPYDIMILESMAHDNQRIVSQSGLFTFTPAHLPVDRWVVQKCRSLGPSNRTPVLIRFLIRNKNRAACLAELSALNINARTVFPDRHGAAGHSNYVFDGATSTSLSSSSLDTTDKTYPSTPLQNESSTQGGERKFRALVTRIHVSGQYGLSYRALRFHDDLDSDESNSGSESDIEETGLGATIAEFRFVGELTEAPTNCFIKCPPESLTSFDQEEFVQNEFENGSAINHAAERAETKDDDSSHSVSFTMSKLIGRGTLTVSEEAITQHPCLIYEYAGDRLKTNQTVATKRTAKYEGTAKHFLEFARAFAEAVKVLHNQGIVHTCIVPQNIVWSPNGTRGEGESGSIRNLTGSFTLVGFGYARVTDAASRVSESRVSEKDNWFRAPECREGPAHVAFGYAADIYSIGANLYALLVNPAEHEKDKALTVLSDPITDERRLKIAIAKHLRYANEELVCENENILKIIDNCLRHDPEHRYSCVEELIEAINIAIEADRGTESSAQEFVSKRDDLDIVSTMKEVAKTDRETLTYFHTLRKKFADDLVDTYARLGRGHLEVYGHRDRIVTSLCQLLGSAKPGFKYCTMTLPDYWTDENLGSLGRFLTMNKHMARNGIEIERLFLVSCDFHSLPEREQAVLEEQLNALKEIESEAKATEDNGRHALEKGTESRNENMSGRKRVTPMTIKVLEVQEQVIADFERNGELVAYMEEIGKDESASRNAEDTPSSDITTPQDSERSNVGKPTVCLNFFSTAKEVWNNGQVTVRRTIRKVRYWNPTALQRSTRFGHSQAKFKAGMDNAQMLEKYIFPDGSNTGPRQLNLQKLIGSRSGSGIG